MLAKIIAKLELLAQSEKEWKERSRIARLEREEEEKRLAAIKKRKDEEITKFNKLVALSEQHNKTLLIRQYIEAVKEKAINTNNLTPEKQEWINWATDKADWLDPLINKPDVILDS
jgi:Ulp1 family protease